MHQKYCLVQVWWLPVIVMPRVACGSARPALRFLGHCRWAKTARRVEFARLGHLLVRRIANRPEQLGLLEPDPETSYLVE